MANQVPGATYDGTVEGGGTVSLIVSADGTGVTSFTVSPLPGDTCTFDGVNATFSPPLPIRNTNGPFDGTSGPLMFAGSFPGAQTAEGILVMQTQLVCTTGTRRWSATTTSVAPPPPDTVAPETMIVTGPPNKTDKTSAKFTFNSNEPGSTFECKLDKKAFKACSSPNKVNNLDPGKHTFQVQATDAAGNVDLTPATDKFKVVGE